MPQDHSLRCMKDLMPQAATVSAVTWGMLVFTKEKKDLWYIQFHLS